MVFDMGVYIYMYDNRLGLQFGAFNIKFRFYIIYLFMRKDNKPLILYFLNKKNNQGLTISCDKKHNDNKIK